MDYCKVCETEIEELYSCAVCGRGNLCENCAAECQELHEVFD
jgi:hypothetical protein